MKRRILSMMVVLMAIAGGATAQTLSVQPIEAQTGEQTEMVVCLTGATAMTALQFNLQLPDGVTVNVNGAMLGAATNGHTLSVQTLDGGDLLCILYSMGQNSFKDGELLRIPVTAGSEAVNASGRLHTVRTATADAVSHECNGSAFSVTTKVKTEAKAKIQQATGTASTAVYDLQGRHIDASINNKVKKGLYIRDGRKVVVR